MLQRGIPQKDFIDTASKQQYENNVDVDRLQIIKYRKSFGASLFRKL